MARGVMKRRRLSLKSKRRYSTKYGGAKRTKRRYGSNKKGKSKVSGRGRGKGKGKGKGRAKVRGFNPECVKDCNATSSTLKELGDCIRENC